jgi:hypothetical protein
MLEDPAGQRPSKTTYILVESNQTCNQTAQFPSTFLKYTPTTGGQTAPFAANTEQGATRFSNSIISKEIMQKSESELSKETKKIYKLVKRVN